MSNNGKKSQRKSTDTERPFGGAYSAWPRGIDQEWSDFEEQVMPPNASDVQRLEMRKSFLSGYLSAMIALRGVPEGLSDNEGAERLEAQLQSAKEALEKTIAM